MSEYLSCPDLEELAAWIDGQVDEPTRRRLVAHVADCDRCAEVMEDVLAYSEELQLADDGVGESADESDFGFAPADHGHLPAAARVSWKPYLAAALAACAMVVGIRLTLQRPPDLTTLGQELQSLKLERPADRGTAPLTPDREIPIAVKCRLFLKGSPEETLDAEVLIGCLDLVARDPDLASQVVVEAPGFSGWLGSPNQLGISSCQVLETAWEHLRKARQDEWRPHHEMCRARLDASTP